ncbi:MAG: 50S ribosomal protein L17 [Patescibacteria group bacterium]
MRHGNNVAKLSLKTAQRKALLKGLSVSLVTRDKIKTTLARAKAVRPVIEKMITRAKSNTLAGRRILLASLGNEKAVKKLIDKVAPKYVERKGGYTRIIKLANRKGDDAPMAIIELV